MKLDKTKYGWWKNAVFYQIYPKSFQDTNGDGVDDPGRFNYFRFTWDFNTRTEEHSRDMTQWGLFYKPNMHQIITFEDGTEWEITTQNKDADIAKIKDWLAGGFEFQSEMSRAARLLDDEMIYEI